MKIFASLVLILVSASLAEARLGETLQQLEARFGAHTWAGVSIGGATKGMKILNFKKQNIEIEVTSADTSVQEVYKTDSTLTPEQIQALLVANSEGHYWVEDKHVAGGRRWNRDDGAKAALQGREFTFKSKSLVDKEEVLWKVQLPDVKGF